MRRSEVTAIVLGGLIAGTIDIFAAGLINHLNLVVILHSIASGLLGRNSFYDGWISAAIGLGLQWAMALVIAAIYVFASKHFPVLVRHWLWGGLAYGVVIYVVMNFVVVPLSAAPFKYHFALPKVAEDMLAMLLFGLIVAFFARRAATPTTDAS
ncbi:MAG: hypothetical protein ABSC92_04815 [Rhizomicrobium sp.]|jgi:hypothetical protein